MNSDVTWSAAEVGGYPVLRGLASFPIACFTCALLTDIAYASTANFIWVDFSDWLLAAGMAGGVLAAIAGLVVLARRRSRRAARPVTQPLAQQVTQPIWPVVLGSLVVLAVGLINNLVHSRDAWTSVVPLGLALSAVTFIVMLITLWAASAGRRGVTRLRTGARA